jgi:hypothetical protein
MTRRYRIVRGRGLEPVGRSNHLSGWTLAIITYQTAYGIDLWQRTPFYALPLGVTYYV